jgi:hypothetical protein
MGHRETSIIYLKTNFASHLVLLSYACRSPVNSVIQSANQTLADCYLVIMGGVFGHHSWDVRIKEVTRPVLVVGQKPCALRDFTDA